ncbi:excisionase [Pantoea sp. Fr+CA_20]|uniref:excisionase n=1 Tax=Pantoea sp. Fr+CA_20 TaxID=2929506 RepID=UPI002740559C|nr:excisionase [Pantoea sp. Fr+CA_20]
MPEITLREWNERQPRPRCMEQVRRWVRQHRLFPPPRLDGREYLIQEDAVKIDPRNPAATPQLKKSLTQRIRNGSKETKQ